MVHTRTIVDPAYGFKLSGKLGRHEHVRRHLRPRLPARRRIGRAPRVLRLPAQARPQGRLLYRRLSTRAATSRGGYNRVAGGGRPDPAEPDGRRLVPPVRLLLQGTRASAGHRRRARLGPGLYARRPERSPWTSATRTSPSNYPGRHGLPRADRAAAPGRLRHVQDLSQIEVLPADRAVLLELSSPGHVLEQDRVVQPLHPALPAAPDDPGPVRRRPGHGSLSRRGTSTGAASASRSARSSRNTCS